MAGSDRGMTPMRAIARESEHHEGGSHMSHVTESVDVAVPVSTAYNQWTQFEEFPKFMEAVKTVRQLDDTHLEWEAENLVEKAGAVLGFDDRAIKADLKNFKKFIEERGVEDGAWRGTVTS